LSGGANTDLGVLGVLAVDVSLPLDVDAGTCSVVEGSEEAEWVRERIRPGGVPSPYLAWERSGVGLLEVDVTHLARVKQGGAVCGFYRYGQTEPVL
jgi:hypothetical protein